MSDDILPQTPVKEKMDEWFLETLAKETIPVDHMFGVLTSLAAAGEKQRADGLADLLQEALRARRKIPEACRLLQLRCDWNSELTFKSKCAAILASLFEDRSSIPESIGLAAVPVKEALRRLNVLVNLGKGVLCWEKTWRFGVVAAMDDFYRKVTVDFDGKRGHQMTYAYACETLKIVDGDHMMAVRRADPAAFSAKVKEDPAEIVRMAIRSFGPMSATDLRDLLVQDNVLPDAAWKAFWDNARKELKKDELVELPRLRNDPIKMLGRPKDYASELVAKLKVERDANAILDIIDTIRQKTNVPGLGEEFQTLMRERLAYVFKAGRGRQHDLVAKTLLAAAEMGVKELGEMADQLINPVSLAAAMSGIAARDIEKLLKILGVHNLPGVSSILLDGIPSMQATVLEPAVKFLVANGAATECAARLRAILLAPNVPPEVLFWMGRNIDLVSSWGVMRGADLVFQIVNALEFMPSDRSRIRSQISALFEQKNWLTDAFDYLTLDERRAFVTRINSSRAWNEVTRRAILAETLEIYPELQKFLSSEAEDEPQDTARRRLTSWRSYRKKQEELKWLAEKAIPDNSKEIAHARSYGDLRENFEYKTAKERQRLLMRRLDDTETDLKHVQGTDFAGFATDKIGMGTRVVVARPDGKQESFNILGEWDADEALGIISCKSRMAELLEGHKPGDEVALPTNSAVAGEETCRIVEVSGVPDEVKKWMSL